jgi:hypothetical protein
MTFEVKTEGRTPAEREGVFTAPYPPDGLFEVPVYRMPEDPYNYEPMGLVRLDVGQQVFIRTTDGTGEWALGWTIRKERTMVDKWKYEISTQGQLKMF